jgi:hypothetical protein
MKTQERIRMQTQKENEISNLKSEITQFSKPQEAETILTQIRSTETIKIESNFTKRKLAVPARDGRDMYADEQIGPIIPDVKKKSPQEQLE